MKGYQRKLHNYTERMPAECFPPQTYFVSLLEDGTLDIQEDNGRNNFFSLETGHDPILVPAEEENEEDFCNKHIKNIVTILGVYDYRRGADWILDLLTTYLYHLEGKQSKVQTISFHKS